MRRPIDVQALTEWREQMDAENRVVKAVKTGDLEKSMDIVSNVINTICSRKDFDELSEPVRSSLIVASHIIDAWFVEEFQDWLDEQIEKFRRERRQ